MGSHSGWQSTTNVEQVSEVGKPRTYINHLNCVETLTTVRVIIFIVTMSATVVGKSSPFF